MTSSSHPFHDDSHAALREQVRRFVASRTPLDKMGWRCSDTATLYFDACRVPAGNLVGAENQGFGTIMLNFNRERLMLAAQAWATAQV